MLKQILLALILTSQSLFLCDQTFAMGSFPRLSLTPCANIYQSLYNYPGCTSATECHSFDILLATIEPEAEGADSTCTVLGTSMIPDFVNTSEAMSLIAQNSEGEQITVTPVTEIEGEEVLYFDKSVEERNFFDNLTNYRLHYQDNTGRVQKIPVHFISFRLDGTSLGSREFPPPILPDLCEGITCTGGRSCVAGECVCPEESVYFPDQDVCLALADNPPPGSGVGAPPPGTGGGNMAESGQGDGMCQLQLNAKPQNGNILGILLLLGLLGLKLRSHQKDV